MQLMQQVAEMRVEMQRRHDLPLPGFAPNTADGRPPIYFPSLNMDPTQNQPSTPVHNPSVIDVTPKIHNIILRHTKLHHLFKKTILKCHTILRILTIKPLHRHKNKNQTALNPQTPHHHLNQNINPQAYPQNYQTAQNVPSPSIGLPLPKRATFQVPIHVEHDVHNSELDHYKEQEREWKAKEDAKINIKEEIKRAIKEIQCIPDIARLSYEVFCIHPDLNLPEGSRF